MDDLDDDALLLCFEAAEGEKKLGSLYFLLNRRAVLH